MTEERLKEIKDSIEFQAIYIKEHNFETALLEEETDLYNEVINLKEENERLKKELNKHIKEGMGKDIVINKAIEYIYHWTTQRKFFFNSIDRQLRGKPDFKGDISDLLNILQGSDKSE